MWHSSGTVRMGKENHPGTCVDRNFQVCGVSGLRVADMSVAPFLLRYVGMMRANLSDEFAGYTDRLVSFISAHTQAAAYLIGDIAAEKIIADYTQ